MRTTATSSVWLAALAVSVWGPMMLSAADASALRVEYDPPRLSVEAAEVALVEVLSAIGAKVGFTVVPSRQPSDPVTVSMVNVAVDDALRRLLRSQNHTILYRPGTDATVVVDRVVLLGPPGEGGPPPPVASPVPLPAERAAANQPPIAPPGASSVAVGGPASPAPGTAAEDNVTVGDMLRSQALTGVPQQQPATGPEPQGPNAGASLEESLAITTRRAQQGLSSLVESLERATQALQQQQPTPPTPGH